MKADLTRDTFNPQNNFLRVLMQQGRVQLDADGNEQTAILVNYLRALAADLMGPFAASASGFELAPITGKTNDFSIGAGRYYIDGLLCENVLPPAPLGADPPMVSYLNQPYLSPKATSFTTGRFLFYLDVWERYLSTVEADLMEPALQGCDTTTRTQIVWQVKVAAIPTSSPFNTSITPAWKPTAKDMLDFLADVKSENLCASTGQLQARAQTAASTSAVNPCVLSADAQFRGLENQLYRVEIHDPGYASAKPSSGTPGDPCLSGSPTFKWSRENGSVIFAINAINDSTVSLANLGRDSRYGLQTGDWVELLNDTLTLTGVPGQMLQVTQVDPANRQVTLSGAPTLDLGKLQNLHPLLRRWDQFDSNKGSTKPAPGVTPVTVGNWINLENGVQICFQGGYHRTGDYWLLPARVAFADLLWPKDGANPVSLPARTIEHAYAPLALCDGGTLHNLRPILKPTLV